MFDDGGCFSREVGGDTAAEERLKPYLPHEIYTFETCLRRAGKLLDISVLEKRPPISIPGRGGIFRGRIGGRGGGGGGSAQHQWYNLKTDVKKCFINSLRKLDVMRVGP